MFTRFVDVAGVATRCMVAGEPDAPALLLVHGLTLTSEIWVRNIDALGRDFFVVAVDVLGHGFTRPLRDEPPGFEEKLEHLERFIETMALEKLAVSGSSYGGLLAANLVLRRRSPIRTLVINGSGSAFNTEAQLVGFVDRIREGYRPTLARSSPEMWRQRLSSTVLDTNCLPCELLAMLPLCYAQPWAVPAWEETIDVMRTPQRFRPYRILERLEGLEVPTLVVWGRDDKGGIYESAVAAVARMPRAELVVFERCAHLPMMEHPERYNELIRAFLTRH